MKIDWEIIKEKIENNVSDILKTGTPSYNNIDEAIDLLRKSILYKSNIHELDGLPRILIPALHEAYITKKGEIGPLRQIATSLEAYLKRLLVLCKNIRFQDIPDSNLISLFKSLELNSELANQSRGGYPQLEKENLDLFKGKDEYLEYLCYSRIIRNEVHNSPNWNEIEVFTYLRNILVIYLYSTLKYKSILLSLPRQDIPIPNSSEQFETEENKMLFDFISFGNTTTEIKTQVINAYMLHFLINNSNSTIETIKENSNSYFGKSLKKRFFERKINLLIQNEQVEFSNQLRTTLSLTLKERTKLEKITKNFTENKELFLLYFYDIISKYNLENKSEELLEKLKDFFVANFNIDVAEAYDKGINIKQNENSIYCELISYLKSITVDDNQADELFRDLLLLCIDSDFLIRISASKVFSRLTNPDQFQNYVRQQERIVYLDTQIILHALCLNYHKSVKYDNVYYKVTDELVDFVKGNTNIKLKISRLYLSEVIYQLKLALLLIPFEDFAKSDYSNNIFYLFYNYLKKNEFLEENHNTFANFLNNWLLVSEDDVYEQDFEEIAKSNLKDLLKDELNIEVVYLPKYENRENAVGVLEKVIKDNLFNPKPRHVLVNDALMVCHLSDNDFHNVEPFFLTWDKAFTEFRKEFKNRFSRTELISWHLFNPSKFINHMALLDFKIDPKSITNEYLSIIDSFGIHGKTQTIFDSMNKFLDLKDISKGQRRKYIKIAGAIFNEKEFSYDVSLPEESIVENISSSFGEIIEKINNYYQKDSTEYSVHLYRKAMLDEFSFKKIADVLAKELKASLITEKISDNYLKSIDNIIKEYEVEIKTKHNTG